MRHFVAASLLTLLLIPALAAPADAPATGKPTAEGLVAKMMKEIDLTADQQAKIDGLLAEYRAAQEAWENTHREEINALNQGIRTAEQANRLADAQRLRNQLAELMREQSVLLEQYQREIDGVLTPEQLAAWQGALLYQQGEFASIRQAVKLTPEQEAKLKEQAKAFAAARRQWEAEHGEKVRELERQIREARAALAVLQASKSELDRANQDAIQALLTPEQKAEMAAAQLQRTMVSRLGAIALTEEQTASIKALCATAVAAIEKIPEADRHNRWLAEEKLYRDICDQVLTEQQRASLQNKPR